MNNNKLEENNSDKKTKAELKMIMERSYSMAKKRYQSNNVLDDEELKIIKNFIHFYENL